MTRLVLPQKNVKGEKSFLALEVSSLSSERLVKLLVTPSLGAMELCKGPLMISVVFMLKALSPGFEPSHAVPG